MRSVTKLEPAGGIARTAKSAPAWMAIFGRELSTYLYSPIAYIVTGLFLVFSGIFLFSTFFLVNRAELRGFFSLLPLLFAFFVPAITMRLFAEERRSGTMELLFTMPVSGLDAHAAPTRSTRAACGR